MEETSSTPTSATKPAHNPLAKFPPAVRAAHQHFLATGDIAALDTVVIAVVRDHQPKHLRKDGAVFPDSAALIGELGFDSLALAEIVFFIEDLYQVSITQQELANVATVGDLRAFIRAKLTQTQSG
jgi:acyl carrier protein